MKPFLVLLFLTFNHTSNKLDFARKGPQITTIEVYSVSHFYVFLRYFCVIATIFCFNFLSLFLTGTGILNFVSLVIANAAAGNL